MKLNYYLSLAALIPAAILFVRIYQLDHIEKEPRRLLGKLVLFGALAAVPAALAQLLLTRAAGAALGRSTVWYLLLDNFVIVACSEELAKLLPVRLAAWDHPAFDYRFDAIVYSVSSALGFAAVENILYVLQSDLRTAVSRAILSVPGHFFFAVSMGLLLSRAKQAECCGQLRRRRMLALLALIVVLAVHSLMLPGAAEGVKFYLLPDFQRAAEQGIGNVMTAAMNQSFFTLSLGIAAMEIFGSYMSRDNSLTGESVRICCLDTFVALMSGLIIFPACFAFGVQPDAGPSLIFITLPRVFVNMAGGRVWGALFFLFMTFASFTTVLAVFENIMASCIDTFGWTRKKATLLCCVFILVASMPCVLGYNQWYFSVVLPNAPSGGQILDIEDFLVSNLLLPLGSLVYLLFCVTKWGWGFDKYLAEANTGSGLKMSRAFKPYFQFILPVIILVILIQGLIIVKPAG